MKYLILSVSLIFLGAGCVGPVLEPKGEVNLSPSFIPESTPLVAEKPEVVLPIENYKNGRTFKLFGEYIEDRFKGYHVGDDVEVVDKGNEISVVSIADGIVGQVSRASGYGGLVSIDHLNGLPDAITALYGHLDLNSVELKPGDKVEAGQFIGYLGDDQSPETDGERKHLHFALYTDEEPRVAGYVADEDDVRNWINPTEFFSSYKRDVKSNSHLFQPDEEVGGNIFRLRFDIPDGWAVEYVPSLKALNLFTLAGEGSARERSQVIIRYFDATEFLTLSTVTIHEQTDLNIGRDGYTARRYDIEKKSGVRNFLDQPVWRNERHIVTDFRDKSGFTRYYVVAANPELDNGVYEGLLESMKII